MAVSGGRPACQTRTVARFEPFPGIRYDLTRKALASVIAPPYDVIDSDDRRALVAQDPHNAVLIDLPDEADGDQRYDEARDRMAEWRRDGILVTDPTPTFTVYRMVATDDSGVSRQTTGVIGALELSPPGTDILPHEHTTPKAKSDRLDLLRATRANLSAIWGLSLARGLTGLLPVDTPPTAEAIDPDGVRHTVWVVDDPAVCEAISTAVAGAPIVVADGHHRYETSLAYRREREGDDDEPGPAGLTMAYVVELVEDELTVHAIHRLLDELPSDFDLVDALSPWFEMRGSPAEDAAVTQTMADEGCLVLVLPDREVLMAPRPEALREARDLDSSRLDIALAGLPSHRLTYQHGVDNVRRAVRAGDAQAGVLLRPASVTQIEATAHGGERMPPKTTFFHPKPKTGLVFRDLD